MADVIARPSPKEESCELNRLSTLYQRVLGARRLIRLHPFDVSTSQGRSDERYRRVVLTTATQAVAKGVTLLVLLISIPLTIRYLGSERYGIWMMIASVVAMLQSADLGIGFGLMNMVAKSYGEGDWDAAARYVSSGFFLLIVVAAVMLTSTVVVYPHISWQHWFNLTSAVAIREAGPTLLVLVICVAVNIPLAVTLRVQSGLQEGYVANLWNIVGQFIALGGVLIAIQSRAGLPWLVLAFTGAPAIAALLNAGQLFFFRRPEMRPRPSLVRSQNTTRLLSLGILFFVYQMTQVVGFQSDNVVIAHILGAGRVPEYAVSTRMFAVVNLLIGFIIVPLWPAYGEALARGDIEWLRRTLVRSVTLVLSICIPVNIVLVLVGRWILSVWVGPQLVPSLFLLAGIGLAQTLWAIVTPLAAFLNGLNLLKWQVFFASLMAVSNISVSVYLTRRIGVPGVIYGSVIAETIFFLVPFPLLVRNALAKLSAQSAEQGHPISSGRSA